MKKRSNETTTTAEAMDELRRTIRTEAAAEALKALREVCNDPKAPAPARAAAASSIFRAGGFFDKVEGGDGDKNLSEMSPAEIDQAIKATQRLLEQSAAEIAKYERDGLGVEGGVFD